MWVLIDIFWGLYLFIGFGVVCAGVFGIAATKSDRWAEAEAKVKRWKYLPHYTEYNRDRFYKEATKKLYSLTVYSAMFWPVAIPLYLAWKKGSFINDALRKREELLNDEHSTR